MSYSEPLWSKVIMMTDKMLDHARQEHWPDVTVIESQRQVLIKQCFDSSTALSALATVRDNIMQVMRVDKEISQLCEKKRASIAIDLNGQRHSRKACQSYQQCG
ncbi:MAG: hypothetical protein COC09_03430 [Gammaproteobacteria bacterium]|nr:flagellar protein FliT [Gammaproteobacteria bacterium]PCH62693.1 MAG: hypothetical protein COC09_07695 [Gammaproteobacteria bacterium]PCH64138.1 MAG: hypothetical protein COC09_03430 [Gammaproteobacteria bacterium]